MAQGVSNYQERKNYDKQLSYNEKLEKIKWNFRLNRKSRNQNQTKPKIRKL
jgi:hypothetical protein